MDLEGVRRGCCLFVVSVGALLALTARASAGEFQVLTCDATPSYSSQAFAVRATRGMWAKRACNPQGQGVRGLVVASMLAGPPLPVRSRSIAQISAPSGTQFSSMSWTGAAMRSDCGYALQLFAWSPSRTVSVKNIRAGQNCPAPSHVQAAVYGQPRTYDIGGTTQIIQRIICANAQGCSAHKLNYLRTNILTVTVFDPQPPAVQVVGGPLAGGGWVRGTQALQYVASDNVGIRSVTAIAGGSGVAHEDRSCDYTSLVPCPSGGDTLSVNTAGLPDGTQPIMVRAVDAAGNVTDSAPATAHIDNTAPGRVDVQVAGGEGWRRAPQFTLGWANPSEPDRAPIVAAHWQLCHGDGAGCVSQRLGGSAIDQVTLKVPAPGTWKASVWTEDAAGNSDQRMASVPVTLQYDPDPPQLAFEPQTASDPTAITVHAIDAVSGMAGGTIEISRQGSGTWQQLATSLQSDGLVAHVPDDNLPPGDYLARVHASDAAGNEASTDRRADGAQIVLHLPLRAATRLEAAALTRRRVAGHWKTVLDHVVRVPLGTQVRVNGRVTGAPGAQIAVYSDSVQVGTVGADGSGSFAFALAAAKSQKLTFSYGGSGTTLPSQADVTVLVPQSSTIAVSRARVLNGQAVMFAGKLRSLPAPSGGKLVELQVLLSGRWQTFRTTHSTSDGSWAIRYRFKRTCGIQRFVFRAHLPREAGAPFEAGATKPTTVRVRGRPC